MNIPINGLNVHFQVFGEGPPLLLLHGWGDSGSKWYVTAERLSEGRQVFLLDLPGFGGSDVPEEAWGVDDYRKVVEQFVSEMELDAPIVLGHSHGGKIACHFATAGNICSGLVLVASSGVDRRSFEKTLRIYLYKLMKQELLLCGKRGQKILDKLRNTMGSTDYRQAGSMRGTLVRVVNQKLFSILPSIRIPTLIVWGSEDTILDMKQAKIFRRLIPDSYIRVVWGSSHHPHLDAPVELAEIINEFVSAQ